MYAPRSGDLLDNRYRIVSTLATGGFGQTYIAEDTRLPGNAKCVVKHLTPPSSDPVSLENARRLFRTEAETLQRLGKHEQIPQLLAYFEENQEFYLVQELIEGQPLTNELQLGQRWSESEVCQMLQEILSILVFVHSKGVIHRDIKPDNIIRRLDSKLVLVDFGTVKQIRTQILASGQINATIAVGTPGYMPTEQSRGNPRPNSDIYALGIIGIQAVTGLNPTQLQEDSQTGEILWRPWAQISERISQELATIITTMVRYHFRDRYQSATEALQALEPLLIRVSPQPSVVPVNQPQPTQISSQPSVIPVNQPQPTQISSQPSVVPISQPQPTAVSGESSTMSPSKEEEQKSVASPVGSLVAEKGSQFNYLKLLRQAAIVGTGSWLLGIVLVSFLGTVWIIAGFWLLVLGGLIFGLLVKNRRLVDKLAFWVIAVISSVIAWFFVPQNIQIGKLITAGIHGISIVILLAILAGSISFILIAFWSYVFEKN
ncbi:MAG: hypothetical protein Fur006_61420 [Coleofasciculaceae cyanobacterium]